MHIRLLSCGSESANCSKELEQLANSRPLRCNGRLSFGKGPEPLRTWSAARHAGTRLILYYTCVTILAMEKTLTIRLTKDQDRSLTRRARALGKTRSEVVRELIEKGLDEERLGRKIAHLKGILSISNPEDPVRRRIKERNWR